MRAPRSLRIAVRRTQEAASLEYAERDMSACAYFRGKGSCSFGCWEEPRCYTDMPNGGWPSMRKGRTRDKTV